MKKGWISFIFILTLSVSGFAGAPPWRAARVYGLGLMHTLAYSPDGEKLAVGTIAGIEVWDVKSWRVESQLVGDSRAVRAVAWSPDRRQIVSGGEDHRVKIWNAATGELLRTLDGHSDTVYAVAWSPDGSKIASGSGDQT